MWARAMAPAGLIFVGVGSALYEFGRAPGATSDQESVTIEAVEQPFQRLASALLGDPMARHGLPTIIFPKQ